MFAFPHSLCRLSGLSHALQAPTFGVDLKEIDHDRSSTKAGTFTLGDRTVKRLGYGAMQLAGPGVFGPPKDRDAALAVLREAVA